MRVMGMKKEDAWVGYEFRVTYKTDWDSCLSLASKVWEYSQKAEVLVGDIGESARSLVEVKEKRDFNSIPESGVIMVRGLNEVFDHVPVQVVVFNQSDIVRLFVPEQYLADNMKVNEEERLHAFDKFMDSVELSACAQRVERLVSKKVTDELAQALLEYCRAVVSQTDGNVPSVYQVCDTEVSLAEIIEPFRREYRRLFPSENTV